MLKSVTVLLLATVSILATNSVAYSENSAQVRKQYGGVENTPDHLMFDVILRFMKLKNEADKELALLIVHRYMKVDSKASAEEFLQRLLAAGEDMKQTKRNLDIAILCQRETVTDKSKIYTAMDNLDDARIAFADFAYVEFNKTLKAEEKQYFKAWLEDAKEGYAYTAFDHSSLFESSGLDVVGHVQQRCVRFEQENLARTQ